ncbi:MAG: hypothetical protein ACYTEQ_11580 [Planctomycetota bacterium]|jgi:hypothetical protein
MAVNLEIVRGLVEPKGWEATGPQAQIVSPYDLPMDWRIEYEERAAILEYDGGFSRAEANRRAFEEILERISRFD